MTISIEQRKKVILDEAIKIQSHGHRTVIDTSSGGRDGTLLYVSIGKQGIKGVQLVALANGSRLIVIGVLRSYNKERILTELVITILKEAGFNCVNATVNPQFEYSFDDFIKIINLISSDSRLVDTTGGRTSKKLFDHKYDVAQIVNRYIFAIEYEDQVLLDLSRKLLGADYFDQIISLNIPSNNASYREHIVPCVLIHNRVIEMLQSKENKKDIEKMVLDNLKIAHIFPHQAKQLDSELGLKVSMPEGWTWGDDPMARLTCAGITLTNPIPKVC